MSDQTYNTIKQDLRKAESKAAQSHGGNPPGGSNVSAMKSVIDQNTDKSKEVDEHKSNLPLPEQPPVASDFATANAETVGVGSGAHEGPLSGQNVTSAGRGPATGGSSVREDGAELHKNTEPTGDVGRQAEENLSGLPKDALAR
ncbi:hypothetical protein PHISP_00305 [Aspergillus sp. HF37]|nr:hypothetical protein PHISP_00305 [Aspergillus sp. HF37]